MMVTERISKIVDEAYQDILETSKPPLDIPEKLVKAILSMGVIYGLKRSKNYEESIIKELLEDRKKQK